MGHQSHRRETLDYLRAEEAANWVQILGDPSHEQRADFVSWLKSSPQNVADFVFMLGLDEALKDIDPRRTHDIASLVAQVDPRVAPFPLTAGTRAPARAHREMPRRPWRKAGVAAACALALVGGLLILLSNARGPRTLRTDIGEQHSFELPDGSIVQLNADSHATIHFSATARQVRLLRGEALFRVHHEPARPFQVVTDEATIEDHGTQFDVYARPETTRISVLEGRVSVASNPAPLESSGAALRRPPAARAVQPVSLEAEEEASVDRTGNVVRGKTPVSDSVAWRQRRLVFRQESLARIAEEFNRYNRRRLVIEDPGASDRLYTGVFDADDPDSLADLLARDPSLIVDRRDREVTVRTR